MVAIFLCPLLVNNYNMHDLKPLVENWLEKEGFSVSVLANRVDGVKKTGILSSKKIRFFFEDYPGGCSVKIQGSIDVCQRAKDYLLQLPPKVTEPQKVKEVVIKEREIVSVPCPYCSALVSLTEKKCPNCGSPLRR